MKHPGKNDRRRAARPALSRALAAALLSLSACLAAIAQSVEAPPVPIKNFGQVDEHYYRGSQPGVAEFAELRRLGIRTVIDLRKDRVGAAEGQARAEGMRYFNIPLTTKTPATAEQTAYFLALVKDPANRPVYVHCKGGRHRTGQMTAIYRITEDGWTAAQAYEEMKRYDFEDSFFYPRALRRHVFSFYERYAADRAPQAGTAGAPTAALR